MTVVLLSKYNLGRHRTTRDELHSASLEVRISELDSQTLLQFTRGAAFEGALLLPKYLRVALGGWLTRRLKGVLGLTMGRQPDAGDSVCVKLNPQNQFY
jgi:hypothetical protein